MRIAKLSWPSVLNPFLPSQQVVEGVYERDCLHFYLIFHHYNLQNMGQHASCLRSDQQEDAFLENEMRIYKWRADPRANAFLPRVSFAPPDQASRHRFTRFLQHSSPDYLRLDDFKHQQDPAETDILVFERYASTLDEVEGVLGAPEAAYVLTSLAVAFAGLLGEFEQVVVSRNCWFVTKGGQVRAWVNHDPRCNFIDPCSSEQRFGAKDCKGIAFKLLSEVLKCCEESASVLTIFTFLRENIEKKETTAASELFEFMRERISYYSGQARLPVYNSIQSVLRRQTQRPASFSKANVHASVVTCKPEMWKGGLNETRVTWDNERSFHTKSKSVGVSHSQLIRGLPGSILDASPSSLFTNTSVLWQPTSAFSNIIKGSQSISESKVMKVSKLIEPRPASGGSLLKGSEISYNSRVVKMSESLERTEKPKPIIKLSDSDVGRSKCVPVQLETSQHSSKYHTPTDSLKISIDNDPLASQNMLTEEDPKLNLIDQKQSRQEYRASKFSKNSRGRPIERKISILQFEESGRQEGHVHAQTYHEVNSNSLIDQQASQVPWRTNKTITRLINDDTDSLVHSIGSSSDENINGSLYSGVLTHMGRDITRKDIASSIHSHSNHSNISKRE